ncbi:ParB/RepB/Spo0J family partition protein [Kitasatospora sp. NPDC002040]|uniref:ParB/RepB/Spo0J family partition protein n=1 Tax=Kitasatospora sp. NPDC002040 TaxID=3154661 RepID=UPI0033231B1A
MTRAADRLGTGAFGGLAPHTPRGPRSERGRAKAVTEGQIPAYELRRLDLAAVVPAATNPRLDFGSHETQLALGHSLAKRQLTACVAVTREAYLRLWPQAAAQLGSAGFVILNGERRYRAALLVGLAQLDFVVRDDLAATRADFIDHLLLENEDREGFNVIERARGVKHLLDECEGNAAEVARRRGRDRSWVGNQIALLTLPEEIQLMLIDGRMAERYARRLARAVKEDASLTARDLLELEARIRGGEKAKREQERALLGVAMERMLSADNTARPAAPVLSADSTGAAEGGVLPRQAGGGPTAAELVAALGATPAEQAATLRQGLAPRAFSDLLDALCALV